MAPPANLESILMQLQWGDPRCENLELPYAATKHRDKARAEPPVHDPRTFVRLCRGLVAHGSVRAINLSGNDLRRS